MTNPLSDLLRVIDGANPNWGSESFLNDREGRGDDTVFATGPEYVIYQDEVDHCDDCPCCRADADARYIKTFSPQLVRALVEECMAWRTANIDGDWETVYTAREATDKILGVKDDHE